MADEYHRTVFAQKAVELLQIKKDKTYIDATVGGGGHSEEIIEQGGFVFGIDCDQEAIEYAQKRLTKVAGKMNKKPAQAFVLVKGNFRHLKKIYRQKDRPSGILFDLGLSWHQLKKPARGFSFQREGPLDMRMDQQTKYSAYDLVNQLSAPDLAEILYKFGDERRAYEIAKEIMAARRKHPINTTKELAELVALVYRGQKGRIHPATKTFQALRIVVNRELDNLAAGLEQAFDLLVKKGRMAVITFQPAEDKLVYQFFKAKKKLRQLKRVAKPQKVSYQEKLANPAARSAILRVITKI